MVWDNVSDFSIGEKKHHPVIDRILFIGHNQWDVWLQTDKIMTTLSNEFRYKYHRIGNAYETFHRTIVNQVTLMENRQRQWREPWNSTRRIGYFNLSIQ